MALMFETEFSWRHLMIICYILSSFFFQSMPEEGFGTKKQLEDKMATKVYSFEAFKAQDSVKEDYPGRTNSLFQCLYSGTLGIMVFS